MSCNDLSRLLSPKSIAVIGGQSAATVATQCHRIGFGGRLYAVHPTRDELAGVTCVPNIDALPEVPDACFIGVSPERTVEVVEQLKQKGAGGVVCYASGFAEAGESGKRLQSALLNAAGEMPLVGPNCHGFVNYLDGVALWPDHFGGEQTERGPALLMQSGNIGINVTFQQRALAFSYVVAMGNNAQLQIHDYLHAMLDDPRVTAIGMHLEGIANVPEFTAAALRALRQGVPLIAIKTGSSELGAEMALSHTRSLANPDDLVSVMFERFGVARCYSLTELLETLKFVSLGGAITPNRSDGNEKPHIASMSCSGGEASHLADLAEAEGLRFPELSSTTVSSLSNLLGERVHVSNPLDYHTYVWGDEPVLTQVFTALLKEPLDCALLILDYPPPDQYDVTLWQTAERALCAASQATGTRVALVSSLPENLPESARARLCTLNVAPMQGLKECVQAIHHAYAIGRAQQQASNLEAIEHIEIDTESTHCLDEHASKQALEEFGLPVPASVRCGTEESGAAVMSLGFPVVMKALGAHLAHKTELGAVRVGVLSLAEVSKHATELTTLGDELLIESMIGDAVAELFVGVNFDKDFGQVLVLGAGGVNVEMLDDSVQLLLPASREEIKTALLSLRVARLITGYRDQSGDLEGALDAIESVCRYAQANRECLLELDVNPLLVRSVAGLNTQDTDVSAAHERQTPPSLVDDSTENASSYPGAIAVDALIRKSGSA